MKKLTDAEIIKALEHCNSLKCLGCPCIQEQASCLDVLTTNVLEFIERKDAEIERLKKAYSVYEETTGLKQAKFEAYKEFAERLKQVFWNNNIFETCIRLIADNILKELTEETKNENE